MVWPRQRAALVPAIDGWQQMTRQLERRVWLIARSAAADAADVDMTLRLDNARVLPTCPQPNNSRFV
jgi:hypothetical protein